MRHPLIVIMAGFMKIGAFQFPRAGGDRDAQSAGTGNPGGVEPDRLHGVGGCGDNTPANRGLDIT